MSAGFWLRLLALWVDLLAGFAVTWAIVRVANHRGQYVPFEATFLAVLVFQSLVLTLWLGGSLGKVSCGLRVLSREVRSAGWLRIVVRETFGKALSLLPLGLGFLWVGWNRQKRGWHDYLAGTRVVRRVQLPLLCRITPYVSCATVLLATALFISDWVSAVTLYRRMAPRQRTPLAFESRDSKSLVDVSTLSDDDQGRFLDWLNREGQPPQDYVIRKAQEHQVLIFGEIHEQRQLLEFLNDLVPRLYHEAGVRRIAMECCPAARNADLRRLVTSEAFDRELLLSIAREGAAGQAWGFKEYWDVLETVWQLNQSLPADQPRMLVVGICPEVDQPSLMLIASPWTPWWERLRIVRAPLEMDDMASSDAFYAREVEKHIFEPGLRGIVWVGRAHSCLAAPNITANDHDAFPRMGYMLKQKYGDQMFQIGILTPMITVSDVDPQLSRKRAKLPAFLDRLFDEHDGEPVGFDVAGSPFAPLRDELLWEDHMAPRLTFLDRAGGYLMLCRSDRLDKCRWIPGFVTPEMFARLKPYYQAMARSEGKRVENSQQFNEMFAALPR